MSRALFDLTGKLALITGSSQGIGLALAKGLAESGARVVLNGRDKAKLDKAAATLKQAGIASEIVPFDVTDPKAVETSVSDIEERFGAIDILVANAGINLRAPSTDMPPEIWRQVMSTNVDGVWYCCQAAFSPLPNKLPNALRRLSPPVVKRCGSNCCSMLKNAVLMACCMAA